MINAADKLREDMKLLEAEAEQTEDPEERERLRYQISCIGATVLELENPNYRKAGYEGVAPHWYKSTKKIKNRRCRK